MIEVSWRVTCDWCSWKYTVIRSEHFDIEELKAWLRYSGWFLGEQILCPECHKRCS